MKCKLKEIIKEISQISNIKSDTTEFLITQLKLKISQYLSLTTLKK